VQVFYLSSIEITLVLFKFNKNGRQNIIVFFKERSHFVEISDAEQDGFGQVKVSLFNILLLFHRAIQLVKLEGRLTITTFVCLQQEGFGFFEILSNAVAFHIVDAHPVHSNKVASLRCNHVVMASPSLVTFDFGLSSAEFSKSASSTA
jgi:hypothetical protein